MTQSGLKFATIAEESTIEKREVSFSHPPIPKIIVHDTVELFPGVPGEKGSGREENAFKVVTPKKSAESGLPGAVRSTQ